MNDIVKTLDEKNLENITNEEQWKRSCPKCGKELTYINKRKLNRAIKEKRLCRSCSKKGVLKPEGFGQKLSVLLKGKSKLNDFRKKCSHRMLNISPEMRQRLNEPLKRFIGQRKGSVTSDEVKCKLRIAMINYIQIKN